MDVTAALDERCGDGRRNRVVLTSRCWGPRNASTARCRHGGQKARCTEEITYKPLKPIARGMPDDPAEPVVTAACYSFCRRAMGEALTRHSPRPHIPTRADHQAHPGHRMSREREDVAAISFDRSGFDLRVWRDRGSIGPAFPKSDHHRSRL